MTLKAPFPDPVCINMLSSGWRLEPLCVRACGGQAIMSFAVAVEPSCSVRAARA